MPTWDFSKLAPGEHESILETCDVIIFSDVEAKNFQLEPSFFDVPAEQHRHLTHEQYTLAPSTTSSPAASGGICASAADASRPFARS